MTFKKVLTGIICMFVVVVGYAQNDWNYSIGLNYRSFSDVEYKAVTFTNPVFPGSPYFNGSVTDENNDGTFENIVVTNAGIGGQLGGGQNLYKFDAETGRIVQNGANIDEIINVNNSDHALANLTASFDIVRFAGGDTNEFDEGVGYVIGASRLYKDSGDFYWNFELSLSTAFSQTDERLAADVTSRDAYVLQPPPRDLIINDNNATTLVVDIDGEFKKDAGVGIKSANSYLVDYDMDLSVYTVSAGLSTSFDADKFRFNLGAGPSFTMSDLDVEETQTAVVTAGDLSGRNVASSKRDDDSVDFSFGLYANVGVMFDINVNWAFAVEYRYDLVFDDSSTNIADVDLDGQSTQLKLIYAF